MKRLLIFVMILCIAIWLGVGAQEEDMRNYTDDMNADPARKEETYIPEPVPKEEVFVPTAKPGTRLDVTIIDEMNDQFIKLENCLVRVVGELHMVEDSFNYSNTFVEGDRYNITIWIKIKK